MPPAQRHLGGLQFGPELLDDEITYFLLGNLELRHTVLSMGKLAMVGNTMFSYDKSSSTTGLYSDASLSWV